MNAVRSLAGIGLLLGGVWALSGGPVERPLPTPTPVPSEAVPGTLVLDLQDGSSDADLRTVSDLIGVQAHWLSELSVDEALAVVDVPDLAAAVAAVDGHPLVEVVEPELQLEAYGFPDDPMYEKQWNLRAMGAPQAWTLGSKGSGVVVAVVDTGVTKVEDLEGTTVLPGATFVPGTKTAADDQGHGTHVAGTIAQTTNNGKGVAGVAPETTILPVKVLSKWGFGQSSWIASGIDYAADNGADVINLSLGGGYSAVIHNAIKKARKKGVLVVAAAGNSGRRGVGYPGGLAETIGVSATGPDGTLAPYSSYGKGVDISAPGGDKRKKDGGILQDTVDGKGGHHYAEYQGTSMATPHVAGAAAVLLSRGVSADQVEQTLLRTARSDGDWNEKYGHGQLDLAAALGDPTSESNAFRFALGAVFAFLVAAMARTSASFRLKSAAAGGLTAGGLFFLSWLPVPDLFVLRLLSTGLLEWPAVLFGGTWAHFPLWTSAALPLALAFTLGAYHKTRPWALGVAGGFAAMLLHGSLTGAIDPWWMPAGVGSFWLAINGLFSMLLGMGLAGTEILEAQERRR